MPSTDRNSQILLGPLLGIELLSDRSSPFNPIVNIQSVAFCWAGDELSLSELCGWNLAVHSGHSHSSGWVGRMFGAWTPGRRVAVFLHSPTLHANPIHIPSEKVRPLILVGARRVQAPDEGGSGSVVGIIWDHCLTFTHLRT